MKLNFFFFKLIFFLNSKMKIQKKVDWLTMVTSFMPMTATTISRNMTIDPNTRTSARLRTEKMMPSMPK